MPRQGNQPPPNHHPAAWHSPTIAATGPARPTDRLHALPAPRTRSQRASSTTSCCSCWQPGWCSASWTADQSRPRLAVHDRRLPAPPSTSTSKTTWRRCCWRDPRHALIGALLRQTLYRRLQKMNPPLAGAGHFRADPHRQRSVKIIFGAQPLLLVPERCPARSELVEDELYPRFRMLIIVVSVLVALGLLSAGELHPHRRNGCARASTRDGRGVVGVRIQPCLPSSWRELVRSPARWGPFSGGQRSAWANIPDPGLRRDRDRRHRLDARRLRLAAGQPDRYRRRACC